MEEGKQDIIKYHQNKRKKHKIKLVITTMVLFVISIILIITYNTLNKKDIVKYIENTDAGYGVNITENEFYEETYLEEGMDVIASLIKNIDTKFKYNLQISEEIKYKYEYKIIAEVEVKEKTKSNLIYNKKHELINKSMEEVKDNKLNIEEEINIDYNKYNEEIEKLLDIYDLKNTTSELNIILYLNVVNQTSGESINKEKEAAIITIPLTTNTVEITVNENIKNNQGEFLKVEVDEETLRNILIIAVITLVLGIITLVKLTRYMSDTRSAEKMYDDELKKILFDYKNYIQKINNMLDYNDYKVVNVDTFKELMGMREELQSPILMYTEENQRRTTFLIINQNLLFQHIMDSNLIREKLIKMSKEKKEKKNEKNK